MKASVIFIQTGYGTARWIDSIWLSDASAQERKNMLIEQFKRHGLGPKSDGLWAWIVESEIEDAALAQDSSKAVKK